MQVSQVHDLLGFVSRVVAVEPCRVGGLVDNRLIAAFTLIESILGGYLVRPEPE